MEAAAHGELPCVVLVGDSTLDNVVWVDSAADAVPPTLQRRLEQRAPGAAVINLAADGFTSADVLHGAAAAISHSARAAAGDPFPTASPMDTFRPLSALAALPCAPTHVILSVGGNDVREILGAMHELPARVAAFQENYPHISTACEASGADVVIMLQYRPDLSTDADHYGVYQAIDTGIPGAADRVRKLNLLMEQIYPPVLSLAAAKGWDVLDLPNTFDIHDSGLYRHQIEPSARGGALIAELIAHAVLERPARASAASPRQPVMISRPVGSAEILEVPLVPQAQTADAKPGGSVSVSPTTWRITEPSQSADASAAAAPPIADESSAEDDSESDEEPPPTVSPHCLVCEAKGRGADVPTAYRCVPCRCEVLCGTCSAKLATGGKCRGCGKMFAQLERISSTMDTRGIARYLWMKCNPVLS